MKINPTITQQFSVPYTYRLFFTEHLFSKDNPLFADVLSSLPEKGPHKVLFVVDDGVSESHSRLQREIKAYGAHHPEILDVRDVMIVTGGENAKNDHSELDRVLQAIGDAAICRHSFVVAIGGGAVIDMVGYAAAIAHRGVKLIRIPTTVLSQNDSAVGVKNSINEFGKKNFLGTFAPAFAIINDADFLTTLEQRDWISGIAEAVKVALIRDADFFAFLQQNATLLAQRDMDAMNHLIYRCAELHMEHIATGGDPFESGSSRPLDFGHWAAHKLEQMTHYGLRHGEAVAMGIALDVTYAHAIGLIHKATLDAIIQVLEEIGFDLTLPLSSVEEVDTLMVGMEEFREHLGGELTITLISGIGVKHDVHEIDVAKMKNAIVERAALSDVKHSF